MSVDLILRFISCEGGFSQCQFRSQQIVDGFNPLRLL